MTALVTRLDSFGDVLLAGPARSRPAPTPSPCRADLPARPPPGCSRASTTSSCGTRPRGEGGDYAAADLPEAALLQTWAGQAVLLPYLDGRSSTALMERAAQGAR